MFTVSAKGVYGLLAVVELARNFNGKSIQIRDIAQRRNVPQHYLEQILVVLKKAGIVESFRGAQGGYALSIDPRQLTARQVLVALEGPLELISEDRRGSTVDFFWEKLQGQMATMLEISVEEILTEEQRRRQSFVYTI
ncbi:MAG: Rrf2 family transcriptional regulator [Spirochaetes bacterium]|nr:Rrf2 family transcriptional regulator [Spirochaetota bacterium]